MNKDLLKKKEELVEHIGVILEKEKQMAPVAARLFATLMLSCKQGVTFEQLVEDLEASKSTVFTHLNNLQTAGMVDYVTKPGDRKRYFILTPGRLIRTIDEMLANWARNKSLQEEVISYKKEVNKVYKNDPEIQCDYSFNENFLVFLKEATAAFDKLKKNLTKKQIIKPQ